MTNTKKILMVCLGNICRSPLAHGILQEKINELGLNWEVDSAGTSGYHNGEPPDPRSIQEAQVNGINIRDQRSRLLTSSDIKFFDLILAMDASNRDAILNQCESDEEKAKVKMIMNYTFPGENIDVPDPYYNDGFDHVFEILDAAIDHMIELESI